MATRKEETIDEMMARVAGEFRRRAGMKRQGHGSARTKWDQFAEAADEGLMPLNPADPELAPFNRETARALQAGRTVDTEDLD